MVEYLPAAVDQHGEWKRMYVLSLSGILKILEMVCIIASGP